MLDHNEILKCHDKAYVANQSTRERASDDILFSWVTQWDTSVLQGSNLAFRGEFNMIRKAMRQVNADLNANDVQIDFEPLDENRSDGADILDGIYRSDDRTNLTQEAYKVAQQETIVCGFGAWELYTDYRTNRAGDEEQVIRRRPLNEANNNVFWDPNARRSDKSDARYVSVLEPYSPDGYRNLVIDLTGEDPGEINPSNFAYPQTSYTFPWVDYGNELIYVGCFYHREKVTDKILTFEDPLGQPMKLRESTLIEKDIMDELLDGGYEIVGEKKIERWECTKYYVSGAEIISHYTVAGGMIPVVPMYGERQYVEGEEVYEGVVKLAKDPQRLRNFQMSYLADIVSRSPRPKPIFTPEQIQGFEFMYEENGADNNYPYYLQNAVDANGNPVAQPALPEMPEQRVPQALLASMQLMREAIEDVANPGTPQDIADVDLSGKAVMALQRRIDDQSMVYQEAKKHAKRRDAEIYAAMASEIHDTPKQITMTLPDGTRKKVGIMEIVQDRETGEMVVLNDLTNMEFEVYADIGPTYTTKKEETKESLRETIALLDPTDPMRRLLIQQLLTLEDGIAMQPIRDFARKQMVLGGFIEPETEEEMAMMQQAAQQGEQPDPAMLLAQAELLKGQAAQMREQRQAASDAAKAQNDQAKTQIDVFKAQTDRLGVQVDAQKAGAEIDYKRAQQLGQQIQNRISAREALMGRLQPAPRMVQ
jgi:hypothetical protein